MDLLSGLRKGDSSRGGRAEFSWDDVKEDKDRENYLGHSLMAPVGRWQRNKDLTWYSKADAANPLSSEEQRKDEIRRIKEAERDALSEALGFPVQPRMQNPVDQGEVARAIKEAGGVEMQGNDGGRKEEAHGIGFGRVKGAKGLLREQQQERSETEAAEEGAGVTEGYRPVGRRDQEKRSGDRGSKKDDKERWRRHRSRSHSRTRDNRERRHRHRSRSRRGEHRHRDRDSNRPREHRHREDRYSNRPREHRHRDDKDGDKPRHKRHDERRRSRSRSVRRHRERVSRES